MTGEQKDTTQVTIKPAKGRPMLQWVGKRPLKRMTAFPAQQVEVFGENPETGGRLYHGDNKEVLCHLLANGFRGKVDLIYIDPPFDSGADYVRKVELRGPKGTAKFDGETYALGEQIQYTDIWANDNYLQFMYERLLLLKELLSESGHLFLQADDKRGHYLKIVLDEIFGSDNYINDIIWHKGREGGGGTDVNPPLPTEYQNIYLYAKGRKQRRWNAPRGPYRKSTLQGLQKDDNGWFYTRGRMGRKPKPWEVEAGVAKKTYVSKDPQESFEHVLDRLTSAGSEYVLIGDVWSNDLITNSSEMGYPTEKPESLLSMIIEAATNVGDLVLDCFIGSGTTAAVAQKLGRRWIGCDINKGAIQTTSKRLQTIIQEQIAERAKQKKTPELPLGGTTSVSSADGTEPVPPPAHYGFTIYRVNDYDLQIQHNEAVNLACEHIGVTRTKADGFFDGTLGKRLVKIAPFNHPLSPLDLEEIKKELKARSEEQRDVMVVSLGKELAIEKWLDDWNRLRKRGDVPNKIEVVELRTDPKYGKFFAHKPASARVEIKRLKSKITVEIKDFISPSIIERLEDQSGILKPKIDDWRAMVDCVMIDPAYDGKVFNIVLSDIPEKKTDLVQGAYELDPPKSDTTVAVKIVDMLGEEVLVTKELS